MIGESHQPVAIIFCCPPFLPPSRHRAVSLRASVVIPLCNVEGVACILFERRSSSVRSFKNQVTDNRRGGLLGLLGPDGFPVVLRSLSSIIVFYHLQVCFPGGMVEESTDVNIIETSLREMEEEIGRY